MNCIKICVAACMFFVIVFSSCKTIPCLEAVAVLNFISFPDAATDSIIIRKFAKDSGFNKLVDTTVATKDNSVYEKANDTLHIVTQTQGEYPIDASYNYEVYLPLVNKLYTITNIVQEQTEMHSGISMDKNVCVNPIKTYIINGTIKNSSLPNYATIYINY